MLQFGAGFTEFSLSEIKHRGKNNKRVSTIDSLDGDGPLLRGTSHIQGAHSITG